MDLIIDNPRRPDIRFCRSGLIRITAPLVRTLGLRPGDPLLVSVSDGEYLLHTHRRRIGGARFEAQCYPSKQGGRNFCAHSVRLCRAIFSALSLGEDVDYAAFITGQKIILDENIFVPVITSNRSFISYLPKDE